MSMSMSNGGNLQQQPQHATSRAKWEHIIIDLPVTAYKVKVRRNGVEETEMRSAGDVLNEWGELGWELVAVYEGRGYLKRQVIE
jgi:hypothetical protein